MAEPNATNWNTPATRLLGCDLPIVLAPMGAVSGGRLAAAVTRAGGLGLLGPGYDDETWIAREFDAAEGTRVGIGFITWHLALHPERLDAALARTPAAVMLSFGDPAPFAERVREAGVPLMIQVQDVRAAVRAADLGADLIVAQGSEAGGHGAGRGTFALVPAIADAVAPTPVLAAGGVADGRGLAAAMMLGAAGALVGTRLYASEEALGHDNAKARLVDSGGDDTLRTRIFDIVRGLDWPAPYTGRAIRNAFADTWHGREDSLDAAPAEVRDDYRKAAKAGDTRTAVVWASEAIDLIRDLRPAGDIVRDMARDAASRLSRAP